MRLSNGIEVEIMKNDKLRFTKLIGTKLHKLYAQCKTVKTMGILVNGVSSYTDAEFIAEAKATM